MDSTIENCAYHLITLWLHCDQDSTCTDDGDGNAVSVCLPHKNMSHREGIADFMTSRGLATDKGWHVELTAKGIELFNRGNREDW